MEEKKKQTVRNIEVGGQTFYLVSENNHKIGMYQGKAVLRKNSPRTPKIERRA